MALRPRHRRINPVARAPILRKGGAHIKSRSGERQQYKQQLKKQVRKAEAGEGDLSGFSSNNQRVLSLVETGKNRYPACWTVEKHSARSFTSAFDIFIRSTGQSDYRRIV